MPSLGFVAIPSKREDSSRLLPNRLDQIREMRRRVGKLSQEVHSCCDLHNALLGLRGLATALSSTRTAFSTSSTPCVWLLSERPSVDPPSSVHADVAGDRGSPFSPDAATGGGGPWFMRSRPRTLTY